MSSYIETLGGSSEASAYILAVYNLFIVIGAVIFIVILKKLNERTVLLANSAIISIALSAGLIINSIKGYYISFPAVGFFLGVLFTIIIAIGTRLEYRNISVASAFIATIGSCGDIFTPIVTSRLITGLGIKSVLYYVIVLMVLQTVVSFIVYILTKEEV